MKVLKVTTESRADTEAEAKLLIDQYKKGKATYILGNHDEMLLNFLTYKEDGLLNCIYNGLDVTVDQLSRSSWYEIRIDQSYIVNRIKENYPDLLSIMQKMIDKVEIGNFVITHAGYSNLLRDPYQTHMWEVNNWAYSNFFVKWFQTSDDFVLQKTYLFGHWHAFQLRQEFQNGDGKITPEPFFYKNFVGLDACTTITKEVNIYIIDEEAI